MSLQTKLQLKEREQIVDIIQPSTVHHWWLYTLGLLLAGGSIFFALWLYAHGWWGKALLGFGIVFGLYIIVRTWYIDRASCLVVTTDRIIDIHRIGWFREKVSAISLADVDDVVVERNGLAASLLGYGHVRIHPRQRNFVLEVLRVPRPHAVQTQLIEKRDRHAESARYGSAATLYAEFMRAIPNFSEAELTVLYQKIHERLLKLAEPKDAESAV